MAILSGFAPWIVYWVLIGNVPIGIAVVVALVVAVAVTIISRVGGTAVRLLESGAVVAFALLTLLTLTGSQEFLDRWLVVLSFASALIVVLAGVAAGKPFVREFAAADHAPDVIKSDLFGPVTATVTWIWVGAFAVMTVSAAIPAAFDAGSALAYIGYWLVPAIALGTAALASRVLTERMVAEATSPHTVRRTTFVAFKELEIDQLYYLAREKADREAGADMEAYDIKIGSLGVPLTGDESRESWPASYKLRPRRH
ncbi:MAG: hypothetical protein HYZ39_13740 [Mycolicibacterium cosmeticum]|nr:hypothetical protein [Mycolicibacterium cosmeticum]